MGNCLADHARLGSLRVREGDVLWSECYIASIVRQGATKFKKTLCRGGTPWPPLAGPKRIFEENLLLARGVASECHPYKEVSRIFFS
jgi:hypothetical protein